MDTHSAVKRGRALLDAGQPAEAGRLLEQALAARPGDTALNELLAEALLATRRPGLALRALARALAGGETASRRLLLGRALNNTGDLAGAEAAFRRAETLCPGTADASALLGHVLRAQGREDEAEACLRRALEAEPAHYRALVGLGGLRLARGHAGEAAVLLQRATALKPGEHAAWSLLGAARHRGGDPTGAEAAYRHALALAPAESAAWLNLGITLQDAGRLEDALRAYDEAARHAPGDKAPLRHLAEGQLAARRDEAALETAGRLLQADPGNPSALATRVLALHRLGREDEAAGLMDFERLVRLLRPAAPPGFGSLADYNRALVAHVLAHPSLAFEPAGHATRKGRHTRDLLSGYKGPVALLERAVRAAATDYLSGLDLPVGHPFPGPVETRHRLTMWAVVMEPDGHQLPHIHPGAWLSGVYYPELPPGMAESGAHAGWIEFGLPPEELRGDRQPPVRLFRPEEGLMFLFPSYFYHRTLPSPGPVQRISIAFDVLRPAGG